MIGIDNSSILKKFSETMFWFGFFFLTLAFFYNRTIVSSLITTNYFRNLLYGAAFFFVARILTSQKYTTTQIIFTIITIPIGVIVWNISQDRRLFILVLAIIACKDIAMSKIIRNNFILVLIFLLGIVSLALMHKIPNLLYYRPDGTIRRAYGINYPTDFSAYISFLYISWCLIRREKFNIIDFFIGILLALFIHIRIDANLDTYIIFLTSFCFYLFNKFSEKISFKFLKKISTFSFIISTVIILFLSYSYNINSSFFRSLNTALSNRLYLGNLSLHSYPFNIFGQFVDQMGLGGISGYYNNWSINAYFFIDSSYLRLLIMYGLSSFIIVYYIYFKLSQIFNTKNDYFLCLAIILVCIHGIVAQYLIEPSYNVLPLLLFANYDFNNEIYRKKDGLIKRILTIIK